MVPTKKKISSIMIVFLVSLFILLFTLFRYVEVMDLILGISFVIFLLLSPFKYGITKYGISHRGKYFIEFEDWKEIKHVEIERKELLILKIYGKKYLELKCDMKYYEKVLNILKEHLREDDIIFEE